MAHAQNVQNIFLNMLEMMGLKSGYNILHDLKADFEKTQQIGNKTFPLCWWFLFTSNYQHPFGPVVY